MTALNKIDQLVGYALVVASQEDDFSYRELGPIHLIKYVYIADLAFAEAHAGQTLTGVTWRFYHYGPWSEEVYERIGSAVRQLGGKERIVSSKYSDDTVRWRLDYVPGLIERLDEELPLEATRAVRQAVHSFGPDTSDLLNYIYVTPPMLRAAPGERLTFTAEDIEEPPENSHLLTKSEPKEKLSKSAQRRRMEKVKALKERVALKLKETHDHQRLAPPTPEPRLDEIFLRGAEWLNQEAGEILKPEQGEVVFSPDIWKSRARGEKLS
jgi:hypothetical protein